MTEQTASGLLETLSQLSREFGGTDFVRGGGGNGSAKLGDTLWIKRSGTTLAGATPDAFVAMDRLKLADIYGVRPPDDPVKRESLVKDLMLAAVCPNSSGRPSVEAPLHDSLRATFVLHTHPAIVTGMTCAVKGHDAFLKLFPDDLWIPYTDPGYTLSMRVREAIHTYASRAKKEPEAVFLQNHGLIVAANTAEEIRAIHARVTGRLAAVYRRAGIPTELQIGPPPGDSAVETVSARLKTMLGETDAAHVCATGRFDVAEGPISPDHIVYARSAPLVGEPTARNLAAFRTRHGYSPLVVACEAGVFGVAPTEKKAALALELTVDSGLVKQLAAAFGGIHYLGERDSDFIDKWEVEAYRRKMVSP